MFWVTISRKSLHLKSCTDAEIVRNYSIRECHRENSKPQPGSPKVVTRYKLVEAINQAISVESHACEITISVVRKNYSMDCDILLHVINRQTLLDCPSKLGIAHGHETHYRPRAPWTDHIFENKAYHWSYFEAHSWRSANNFCNSAGATLFTISSHEVNLMF